MNHTRHGYETPNLRNRHALLRRLIGRAYNDAAEEAWSYGMDRGEYTRRADDALVRELVELAQLYDHVAMNPPFGDETPNTFRTSPGDRWVAFKLRARARKIAAGEAPLRDYIEAVRR